MEESVALDSSKQKQFVKSIKGIKKILKGKDKAKSKGDNVTTGKIKKRKRRQRGLVYLSHIPHGFYEHQMTEYFKQFGVVTNARVIRSKRTGMSKGHAFVEFRDPNVAQIVAETMNNYLMGKRLIKAVIIPPEKQRKFAKRKHWNAQNNPANEFRKKMKKAHNSVKNELEDLKIARRLLSNLNKTKKKLRELDIDYGFFTPVDIPEPLLNMVEVKKEEDMKTIDITEKENKLKNKIKQEDKANNDKKIKGKKESGLDNKVQNSGPIKQADNLGPKKSKKLTGNQQSDDKNNIVVVSKDKAEDTKVSKTKKDAKKKLKVKEESIKAEMNDKLIKTQKKKEKKLKDAGVKLPQKFIQIQKDSNDSDSSVDFDSDEFDKVMQQDDSDIESDNASDETDEGLDENVTSEEDESVEDQSLPAISKKSRPSQKITKTQGKRQDKKRKADKTSLQPIKNLLQSQSKPTKKPKFEKKSNKKTMKKIVKKKNVN